MRQWVELAPWIWSWGDPADREAALLVSIDSTVDPVFRVELTRGSDAHHFGPEAPHDTLEVYDHKGNVFGVVRINTSRFGVRRKASLPEIVLNRATGARIVTAADREAEQVERAQLLARLEALVDDIKAGAPSVEQIHVVLKEILEP